MTKFTINNNTENTRSNKETIRILFLDIDGVMNRVGDLYNAYPKFMKSEHLTRLQQIIHKTNCKIVLSTARRRSNKTKHKIKEAFIKHGIKWDHIYIGDTPILPIHTYNSSEEQRINEILQYLHNIKIESKYHIESWCVIDDMNLYSKTSTLNERFVKIDSMFGITDIDVMEVIMTLKYCSVKCSIL
eukprot:251510_1